jgi:hypothetical protein
MDNSDFHSTDAESSTHFQVNQLHPKSYQQQASQSNEDKWLQDGSKSNRVNQMNPDRQPDQKRSI